MSDNPFKVGDRVRHTNLGGIWTTENMEQTVTGVMGDGIEVTNVGYDRSNRWWSACNFELVTPALTPLDPVISPVHYNQSSIECIDAIKASMSAEEFQGYLKGNTMKYLWRYRYKGKPVEDLKKAQWYQDRLINETSTS